MADEIVRNRKYSASIINNNNHNIGHIGNVIHNLKQINNTEDYKDILAKLNYPFIYCWIISDRIVGDNTEYNFRFKMYFQHNYAQIGNLLYEYSFETNYNAIKTLHKNAYTGKDSKLHVAQMQFPRIINQQKVQRDRHDELRLKKIICGFFMRMFNQNDEPFSIYHYQEIINICMSFIAQEWGLNHELKLMNDLLMIQSEIQTIESFDAQINGKHICQGPGRIHSKARFCDSEKRRAEKDDNDALSHFLCQLFNSPSFAINSEDLYNKCNINNSMNQIMKAKAKSMLATLCDLVQENIFSHTKTDMHQEWSQWRYIRFHTLSVATRPAGGNSLSLMDHWGLKFEGVKWLLTIEWFDSDKHFVKFQENTCLGQKVCWFSWRKGRDQVFTQRWGTLKKIDINETIENGITAQCICKLLNKWLIYCDGKEFKPKYDRMRNNCQHFVRDFVSVFNRNAAEELTKQFHHRTIEQIITPFGVSSDDYQQYSRIDEVRKLLLPELNDNCNMNGKELLQQWRIPNSDDIFERLRRDGFEDPEDWQDIIKDDDDYYLINDIGLKKVHCNKFRRLYKVWLSDYESCSQSVK